MPIRRAWLPAVASLLVYLTVTAILGRESLAHLSTTILNDAGDPLLTAAILDWNATHVPLTEGWWRFPIFYPTADTMAFSEHLLGLSVVAAPLAWLIGDVPTTYNIVTLLTFPLCGLAMFVFVHRLTGSASGAFLAGLAYAFAPYRISQLPHVQMLASFWAPLALLGLHEYLSSGRRRWLGLYGACWMLQGAANGYALVFFSVLVGLWGVWFVVARWRVRAAIEITLATLVAVLPLVPVLYRYVQVHARHGFTRGIDEVQFFSADVAAVFCAPGLLTWWGWLRVQCWPEGELFPGTALAAICVVGLLRVFGGERGDRTPQIPRWLGLLRRLLFVVAAVYLAIALTILIWGPRRLDLGVLQVTARSLRRPLTVGVPALLAALALSPRTRVRSGRYTNLGFYLSAAAVTWLLSLGPELKLMGHSINAGLLGPETAGITGSMPGPFELVMQIPGAGGLRVPARFWLMTVLCLTTAAGLVFADVFGQRRRAVRHAATVLLTGALLMDGWVNPIPVAAAPQPPVAPVTLRGHTVLTLPLGDILDIPATYFAVTNGWRAINGYSGYHPNYYPALTYAIRFEDSASFTPFQAFGPLDVLVSPEAKRLIELIERQPGVRLVTQQRQVVHYVLPQRGRADVGRVSGNRLAIRSLDSSCSSGTLQRALDNDAASRWVCGPTLEPQALQIDLGDPQDVGAIVINLGAFVGDFSPELTIETSLDHRVWEPARSGSALADTVRSGVDRPGALQVVLPFTARRARYVRVTRPGSRDPYYWTMAAIEAWSSNTGVPVD